MGLGDTGIDYRSGVRPGAHGMIAQCTQPRFESGRQKLSSLRAQECIHENRCDVGDVAQRLV